MRWERQVLLRDPLDLKKVFKATLYDRQTQTGFYTPGDICRSTGKDKGQVSRLLKAENMRVDTLLELCSAIGLEITISGVMGEIT